MATRAISLRTGDARDVAVVDALMAAAFDPRFGEAWTRSQCLGVMAMPGVRLTIAQVDDLPAGFAMVRSVADEAELLLLAVAPPYRRRGVAGALLRAVIAEAQGAGIATLHLEVRAGNDAVRLYETHGFAKVGERRGYYRGRTGESFDAHTYRRAI
ncbi:MULTISPECIES: GNAT family N-acetyltransferase [unclassified Sphingomonas]|jgi:[ribosomal protein S18]-alanine N-acetyltransferase|uniref:GNAT family N-acetyltransferase n=1 Tax=unclassified Sphingomonas TaxID=196159 RepID=UPI000E10E2CA|nr:MULTISPECIES: GNAT family N-acetyltransferase [unclassified Sphingomonas]AXJ95936.1 ribosomal-protein-alanine acetyltransferase [Sphingomonas sp. FARSPH]